MKVKKIWSIITFIILATCVIGCSKLGKEKFSKGGEYKISTTQVEHATFKVVNRDESVESAYEGQKLFVSVVLDDWYELDKVYVNNKENEGISFAMPSCDVNVTITVKEIVSNITIVESNGGKISCDKTSAKYGDIIYITVTPDPGYYIKSRGLRVNSAEVSVPPVYNQTTFEYVMPHTDINISAQFTESKLTKGINFGDFDHKTLAKNSKWDYTLDNEDIGLSEISIQLNGTGDDAKKRDIGFTYYKEKSNYFYFSTSVQISGFNPTTTDENRVGIFFGDGNKMGTIGYYFKKHSDSSRIYLGRKYTSLTFETGYRKVITGYQDIIIAGTGDKLNDSKNVSTDCGGKKNITSRNFEKTTMKMGIIYDGINNKLHILLCDFATNELKYVATIDNLDAKYFSMNSEGKVNFGLYAESPTAATFTFFDMEYSTNQAEIIEKFPEIVGK